MKISIHLEFIMISFNDLLSLYSVPRSACDVLYDSYRILQFEFFTKDFNINNSSLFNTPENSIDCIKHNLFIHSSSIELNIEIKIRFIQIREESQVNSFTLFSHICHCIINHLNKTVF